MTKLGPLDVLLLKQLRRAGATCAALAARFGVSREHVNRVCLGQRRPHIGTPVRERRQQLRPAEVAAIRAASDVPAKELARRYGVSRTQISRIRLRQSWPWL